MGFIIIAVSQFKETKKKLKKKKKDLAFSKSYLVPQRTERSVVLLLAPMRCCLYDKITA